MFRNGSGGDICQIDDNGSLCGWISSDWIGKMHLRWFVV